MRILLTNDDGYDSCALIPTIEALEKVGTVDVVVPEKQQSWTSKSNLRRKRDLKLQKKKIQGKLITILDAMPADCANFGIYKDDNLPDLVVSGANIGMNIGLGMFFSSGTIGAALEGLLAGIPSIAISCPFQKGKKPVENEFAISLKSLPKLIEVFTKERLENLCMMSLNLPLGEDNQLFSAVSIDNFHFGALLEIDSNGYVQPKHYYDLPSPHGKNEGTDIWAKINGLSSVIGLNSMAQFIDKAIMHDWLMTNGLTK